ncbi:MAG: LysR family transcriptional regulator [Candidatus Bathyarchaeota archaeon]|nr:LysR family transcriptional regulator [Candidatus Bathyarchaeota archaeon]
MPNQKPHPAFKIWLETDDGFVFGPGIYSLLTVIIEKGTLKEAAKTLDMSYRYAWGLLRKAEETLGEPLVVFHKGGSHGGGGAELTKTAFQFIEDFTRLKENLLILCKENGRYSGIVESVTMKENSVEVSLKLKVGARLIPGNKVNIFTC